MTTQWWIRSIGGLLVGAIAACSSPPEFEEATPAPAASELSDQAETAAVPAIDVPQVVALTSLTADIIQTLEADALVGIPGSSLLREGDRFAGIEVVSEGRLEPDLEKIVALAPDLVIGAAGFHDKTLDRMTELGIETLTVNVDSWAALRTTTEELAQRLGTAPEPLLARYDACLAKAPETAPSTLVLVSRQPLLSPNQASWAGDFLAQFNIPNLTADLQGESPFDGYVTLSEEKVLTSNPEALIVVQTEDDLLSQLKEDAFWGQLKATQTDAVHTFDYFGLVNPGGLASIEATCDRLANL